MNLSDFDYTLAPELIAQQPKEPRDHSRLLCLRLRRSATTNARHINKADVKAKIEHKYFYDIIDYLNKGDVLVINNSKVFPARLIGKKEKTNGKMEVFLHRQIDDVIWQCIIGGKNVKPGLKTNFSNKLNCVLQKNNQDGTWDVKFNLKHSEMMRVVNKIGKTPLPPYIKRPQQKESDKKRYQTIYADDNKTGSVAAPTAGLHFTPELLKKIKAKKVKIEHITLHVGLGTFAPVKVNDIKKHKMHSEFVEIKKNTIDKIKKAKKENKKIIAVGTTSARSLESFFSNPTAFKQTSTSYFAWVDIFIYPGYKFKAIDAMITNFHLPKSTLLMLVSALAGKNNIKQAYQEAIKQKYRFYSYGDAMLIKRILC
ncbi:MAG: tRNA preQ1(34) S-adenosylmethionine ribosyltransferase-isomerase QueA [Patescibacteria group bacterium]|nr:tRNA preQ1(34) S-adenosylmethionine ribosyltransferase-isomerase QueA [Patescibacteria group bacterium]